jgi:acetyl-CoA acetyltransferase
MSRAVVAGTGVIPFGRRPDSTVRSLAAEAAQLALADAGVTPAEVEAIYFSNAVDGLLSGQEMVRGHVALRDLGFGPVSIVDVEAACASGASAVNLGVTTIESGRADVVLVVGAEKLTHPDKARSFGALGAGIDLERRAALEEQLYSGVDVPEGQRSFFMDIYAKMARDYTALSGATAADFADIAVKSHAHAAHNPIAQFRTPVTREEVLASRQISGPLTLLMCSPIGDGAAALVLMSPRAAARLTGPRVEVAATVLASGISDVNPVEHAARRAYEQAGIGPGELDVVEVHDAAAPAELIIYEELGLCPAGDGPKLLASGDTTLGGRVPVNPSGGLISRGHPVGATGVAQVVEITDQLRGRCAGRQVEGARFGLAENSGGYFGPHPAASAITVLARV